MEAVIFNIQRFSIHDGPGIRTTVFMKGCNLRCRWCHNPESHRIAPELQFFETKCIACGACRDACPTKTAARFTDACTLCGRCADSCYAGALEITGRRIDTAGLLDEIRRDAALCRKSGGGVTFSGGEPLLQWNFVSDVIRRLKGVHTAIETSGFTSDEIFRQAMERCSMILIDWKVSDPELHRHYTGVDQAPIRRHIGMLARGNTPFIMRMPIIPGVNDNEEHFRTAAELVAGAPALVRVDVLPYQPAAGAKYEMVNREYRPDFDGERPLKFHTECFEERGIPFKVFR